jgi:selenocysteine lyase/cysteine desulfurase
MEDKKNIKTNFKSFEINSNYVFCNNSILTQIPYQVLDTQYTYITEYNVDTLGSTDLTMKLKLQLEQVNRFIKMFFNVHFGKIVFDKQVSSFFAKFKNIFKNDFEKGEIIVSDSMRLDETLFSGCKVIEWDLFNKIDNLIRDLTEKTKFIFLNHVCETTGKIIDLDTIVCKIRLICPNVKIIVDGTHYMAHRILNVSKWNVDVYLVSFKSFLLPNLWAIYLADCEMRIESDNNYYEQIGLLGLETYLQSLSNIASKTRGNLQVAYNRIYHIENEIIRLFSNLSTKFTSVFEVVKGNASMSLGKVSIFTIKMHNFKHDEVVLFLSELNVFCEHDESGIKFSFLHYNNCQEVEYILNILEEYNIKYVSNWNLSNLFISRPSMVESDCFIGIDFKNYFDMLSKDTYIKENTHRLYSMIYLPTALIVGNSRYIKENKLQHHQKINIVETDILNLLLKRFKQFITNRGLKYFSYLHVHQIRYSTKVKYIAQLLTNEINCNCSYIGLSIVKRTNISGMLEVNKNGKTNEISLYDTQLIMLEKIEDTTLKITNLESIKKDSPTILDIILIKTVF